MANLIVAIVSLGVILSGVTVLTQGTMGAAIGTSSAVRKSLASVVGENHGEMRFVPTCETALGTTISVEIENTGLTGLHSFSE